MTPRDPLAGVTARLGRIHRSQVHREGWPEYASFDREAYSEPTRARSARQWMRRARLEYTSIAEFTQVAHALTGVVGPLELLGALSRLITDEVRHAELCGRMAVTCWPEGIESEPKAFEWPPPRFAWPDAPPIDDGEAARMRWAADAILTSCCIGETLSLPLFEAVATVNTDRVCGQVIEQILRDEHLHAAFGWEALATLVEPLGDADRAWLQAQLSVRLASYERGATRGTSLEQLAGSSLTIEPGDPAEPNLAILSPEQYAMIFYATVERDILPGFERLGFDAKSAWANRPR